MKHALFIIAIIILFGCKSIERAKQKVLTNAQAFEDVGRKYKELNPCVNDTVFDFIQGDTFTTEVHDTTYIREVDTDSIYLNNTVTKVVTRTVTKVVKDTVKAVVEDKERVSFLTAKLAELSTKQYATNEGKAKAEKNAKNYLIALVISVLLNLALFLLLFKRK
jgi:hypothetical protein